MALVEIYHVVAASRSVAASEAIQEGNVVSLDSSGNVRKQSNTYPIPYGIAGDTADGSTQAYMPDIASGSSWQNRASDYFDETSASGKMTVYHSGGEFATDQFNTALGTMSPMRAVYASNGQLSATDDDSTNVILGYLLKAAGSYPSGVPGVDIDTATTAGEKALASVNNSNTYLEFKLSI